MWPLAEKMERDKNPWLMSLTGVHYLRYNLHNGIYKYIKRCTVFGENKKKPLLWFETLRIVFLIVRGKEKTLKGV